MTGSDGLNLKIKEHEQRKEADALYCRTFECASKDLLLWMMTEEKKLEGKFEPYEGLDGLECQARNEIYEEYRLRLRALKAQFNVD